MSSLAEKELAGSEDINQRIWDLAIKFRDSGVIDFTGMRFSYGNLLHEFEKQQVFLGTFNQAHLHIESTEGAITPEEQESLTRLRKSFPSDEDRIWLSSLGRR
ncbi:MAG TPA: hypothetical protein VLE51_00035 [Candidatus Saccharimonadales bacterium]|nr:hypothetical protein [Candidatus Saccharimonadales bacterium]